MSIEESELLLNSYKYDVEYINKVENLLNKKETINYFSKNNSPIQHMKSKIMSINISINRLEQPSRNLLMYRYPATFPTYLKCHAS